jgi:hypothetical protein
MKSSTIEVSDLSIAGLNLQSAPVHLVGGFNGPSTQRRAMTDFSGSGPSQSAQRSRPSVVSEIGVIALPHNGQGFLMSMRLDNSKNPQPARVTLVIGSKN